MNARLEFLSRRNEGKRLMPDYLHALSEITGISFDALRASVLDLEKSDLIRDSFILNVSRINNGSTVLGFSKATLRDNNEVSEFILSKCSNHNKILDCYLITKASEFCGVIKFDFDTITPCCSLIARYDEDFAGLVSNDLSHGVMVDFCVQNNSDSFYEVILY